MRTYELEAVIVSQFLERVDERFGCVWCISIAFTVIFLLAQEAVENVLFTCCHVASSADSTVINLMRVDHR